MELYLKPYSEGFLQLTVCLPKFNELARGISFGCLQCAPILSKLNA